MKGAEALADRIEDAMGIGGWRRDAVFIAVSAICLLLSFLGFDIFGIDIAWVAVILCGIPISVDAIVGLLLRHDIKADVIVFVALVAALYIGDVFTAGEVAAIMQIGGLLEDLTAERSRKDIDRLLSLAPTTACRITDGMEEIVPALSISIGDVLRVRPGETVPADGRIVSGESSIDNSAVTGESLPVDRAVGEEVFGGTMNLLGAFDMVAERDGNDCFIQRMARMVESADAGRSKVVSLADRWAGIIVLVVMAVALSVFLFTGDIVRTVAVLVVFCPCAFVLATPTAIVAAIGNASRHGFLVRDGGSLERLSKVDKVVFDKTGTLTCGELSVTATHPNGIPSEALLRLAASVETVSEHPLGKAIVAECRRRGYAVDEPGSVRVVPGKGIVSVKDGTETIVGNAAMMEDWEIELPTHIAYSGTAVHVSRDGIYLGSITLSDRIRIESYDAISSLLAHSIEPVLATGDSKPVAESVARKLCIKEVHTGCLPEDKLALVQSYGGGVCMVGDGINDSPSLRAADVGISMGGIGSDIAIEASDIVAVNDGIGGIPGLISLSKAMMARIRMNITVAMCLNAVAIGLAIAGILTPFTGALVHNIGSVFVVVNSALILRWKWLALGTCGPSGPSSLLNESASPIHG